MLQPIRSLDEGEWGLPPQTGSPAIGRGGPLNPDSAGGVPAGVPVDMGALQATTIY